MHYSIFLTESRIVPNQLFGQNFVFINAGVYNEDLKIMQDFYDRINWLGSILGIMKIFMLVFAIYQDIKILTIIARVR